MGVIRFDKNQESRIKNQEEFELALIDAGADDIVKSEFGTEIRSSIEKFQRVLEAVKAAGAEPLEAEIEWVAKESVALSADVSAQMEKFFDALSAHDDVRAVYTNES
jgi:transcriptional/translational regulatory protein YebC/TACO1